MEFEVEFDVSVKTSKGRILTEEIERTFDLPYYKEDMHPDGLGYYMYFADERAEERAILTWIESVEVGALYEYFWESLEDDEELIEVIRKWGLYDYTKITRM